VIPVQDGLLLTVPPVLRLLVCGIGFRRRAWPGRCCRPMLAGWRS